MAALAAIALGLSACGGSGSSTSATTTSTVASAATSSAPTTTSATTSVTRRAAKRSSTSTTTSRTQATAGPTHTSTTRTTTATSAPTHTTTTTTRTSSKPTLTPPMQVTLTADDHAPVVSRAWHYTVTVTDARGVKLSGTETTHYTFNGAVVGTEKPTNVHFSGGIYRDTIEFPAAAVGNPLAVQVVIQTSLGTATRSWPIKVVKA